MLHSEFKTNRNDLKASFKYVMCVKYDWNRVLEWILWPVEFYNIPFTKGYLHPYFLYGFSMLRKEKKNIFFILKTVVICVKLCEQYTCILNNAIRIIKTTNSG